ncbi:urea transporter [Chryseobacterium sp. CKR4-1]|uniref:urea transporter n=1 Tax=Chryseobacterium sp. CKR4-1 TaxID=3068896 RepID=UPI002796814D|nr:urea transporter [Chryseobacterium sp. CKR4-1]MDQ1805043.1 urea transporter [Chryseobacterium sp. CKR4-1]
MDKFFQKIPFIDNILKGVGQIMLQENRWTGLLFIIGIFMGSWQCGVAVIMATAAGTFTAMKLKYDKSEIDAGLYGFSAALVGVALAFIFQATLLIWVLIIMGGALASIIQHFFIQKKIPVFTFPFIVITWALVFLLHHFTHILPSDLISAEVTSTQYDDFLTCTKGFGEVIFQGGVLSGLIFFLAVFISSPIAALYGLVASILGAGLSQWNGEPIQEVHMGLFGFNAVLSAIVFSGAKKTDGLWVLIAVFLTVAIDDFLIDNNLLSGVGGVFTFPFVAGTWITLLLKKFLVKNK